MVLTAQGSIYRVSDAAVAAPTATSVIQECNDSGNRRRNARSASSRSTSQAATVASEALQAQVQYAGGATTEPAKVYLRSVDVLAGPLTVTSMTSRETWSGWFTSIASINEPISGGGSTPINATSEVTVIQPKKLQLQIFEGHDYGSRAAVGS